MQIRQKIRRSFALIGVVILCIVTVTVPISADFFDVTFPTSDPVRCLYHLQITTSTEGSFFLGPLFPETDDPDAEWGIPRLYNAVIVLSRSGENDGKRVFYQSEQFSVGNWYDGDAEGYLSISPCSFDYPGAVVEICYSPYGVMDIYSAFEDEYFETVDIYVRPQYSYDAYPEIVTPTAEELETYSILTQWGFSSAINPYPERVSQSEIDGLVRDAYLDGKTDGYDKGFSEGKAEGYDNGFRAGQTDVLNGNATLKDLIFSIFSAPVDLINGILDFDLFGINFASFVRSLITLVVVGIVLVLYFKFSKGG